MTKHKTARRKAGNEKAAEDKSRRAEASRRGEVPQARQDSGNDPPPRDTHELRIALVRKMNNFLKLWRRCPLPVCRRGKTCLGHTSGRAFACDRVLPPPKASPEQQAAAMAALQRALKRRLAAEGRL